MKSFRFLQDNDDDDDFIELPEEVASWMWHDEYFIGDNISGFKWQLESVECQGIIEFLNLFPMRYIVPIYSITGNDIRHDSHSERGGWGFNIQTEHLTIEYFTLVPDNVNN